MAVKGITFGVESAEPATLWLHAYVLIIFLYALTCNKEMEDMDIIVRQKEEDFCWKEHPISSPACVTHQLLGIRFMERRNCGDPEFVQQMIKALQDKIIKQLTWDFRVVDVYIRRVLMLTDSGAKERIKPLWIKKILAAQLFDGGWGANDPIIPVGFSRYLSFTGVGISIKKLGSNFHTTVQGVLLMSLLVSAHP